jgi:putative ABC transport system substrate-binding protein
MLDRRRFLLTSLAATLAAPLAAEAQQRNRPYRIGILSHSFATSELVGPHPQSPYAAALLQGMRELGYEYGKHFVTEARGGAGRPEQWATAVTELLDLQIDVIVASGLMLQPLKEARPVVPVVMAAADDPVAAGLVVSLAQPGGQFTGLSHQMVETTAKRLELLKELVPGAGRVAVLAASTALTKASIDTAARERGWSLLFLEIRGPDDVERVLKAAQDLRAEAYLVAAGGFLFRHARRVAELIARTRLPAMYPHRIYTEAGGLMSYNDDLLAIWRRAATFVDKILKGAKPTELPIEQPTKFELVINLKAAKALGLTIPPSLLARADQVIE